MSFKQLGVMGITPESDLYEVAGCMIRLALWPTEYLWDEVRPSFCICKYMLFNEYDILYVFSMALFLFSYFLVECDSLFYFVLSFAWSFAYVFVYTFSVLNSVLPFRCFLNML